MTIKEIKKNLLSKNPEKKEKINLYYKGNPLTNDDEFIGNIIPLNNTIDLVMVSLTLNESMNSTKEKEKIINKLSSNCSNHNDQKELNICINCSCAICDKCKDLHKNHKIINKNVIINNEKFLEEYKTNINNKLNEINIGNEIYDCSKVCNDKKEDLIKKCDKMIDYIENIKKVSKKIFNDFNSDFDTVFPNILATKEKIDILIQDSKNEKTVTNEKKFIDYYVNFNNIKNNQNKMFKNLKILKNKIDIFNDVLDDFNKRVENINLLLQNEYNFIKDYKLNNDYNINSINIGNQYITSNNNLKTSNLNKSEIKTFDNKIQNNNNNENNNNNNNINYFDIKSSQISNSSFGRMNLVTLLSPPKDKQKFIKESQLSYRERLKSSKLTNTINLLPINSNNIPEEVENEDNSNENYIYNIGIKTNFLFCFNKLTKTISKIPVNLSNNLKNFESYHSTLNYKGNFYLSGGYTTAKMFMKFNKNKNEFINLIDMQSGHSYHRLIGIENNIISISGFKNKKVEKFNLNTQKWSFLPSLEISRSWPSVCSIDDKIIFLFGGLCDSNEEKYRNLVEKLDVTKNYKEDDKWETFEVKSEIEIPFYLGILKLSNEKLLLLGGKYDLKEDNIDTCFVYNYKENHVEKENEFKLPLKDEFNGKEFILLENDLYGQFSSFYSNYFYVVDVNKKAIELIKYEENDNNDNNNNIKS